MKRIIIFNASSSLYGAERGLLNLIKALKDDFEITVVIPRRGVLKNRIEKICPDAEVIIFPLAVLMSSSSPLYLLKFIFLNFFNFFYFLFYINYNKIDLVVTNSVLLTFPALCSCFLNRPHIWHIREFFPSRLVNYFLGRYIKIFSSHIICQSEFIKHKFGLKKKAKVIYEPLDEREYKVYRKEIAKERLNVHKDTLVITLVSRIHPSKGQYEFIVNMRDVLKNNPKLSLIIAGDVTPPTPRNIRYKRKIIDFIKDYNLKNIILTGFTDDVGLIYSASDICIFPFKREEPFGICVAEALSFGKITFYPFEGGLREVYGIFNDGYEFIVENVLKTIENFIGTEDRYKEIVIPQRLSFSCYMRDIEDTYCGS